MFFNSLYNHPFITANSSRFISTKACVEFSIVDSISFLLSLHFCLIKCMDSLTLKHFLKLGFTPWMTEQPLRDMELQEKETQKDQSI